MPNAAGNLSKFHTVTGNLFLLVFSLAWGAGYTRILTLLVVLFVDVSVRKSLCNESHTNFLNNNFYNLHNQHE